MKILQGFKVFPWGVEPQSSEPESEILSIELWEREVGAVASTLQSY